MRAISSFTQLHVNDETISLPYSSVGSPRFSILRDLSSVTTVLGDALSLLQGTKITCSVTADICVVFADDWVSATATQGLLAARSGAGEAVRHFENI